MPIDLDAKRRARAAAREGRQETETIVLGGKTIATLPVELPLDIFAPIRDLDEDITMVVRSAVRAARGQERTENTEIVVDLLAANPALPMSLLDALRDVGSRLLGDDGMVALLEARPSAQDYSELVQGLLAFYGVSLGESLPPSTSQTESGSETSSTTSQPTSDSTPETPSGTPAIPASSEPVAS